MRAILICPAERPAVACLQELMPLVLVPMLGKPLVDYWLEHLAARKFTDVVILAADRPDELRAYVAEGQRYGVRVDVWPAIREMCVEEAVSYVVEDEAVDLVEVMEFVPSMPDVRLFEDYHSWFSASLRLLSQTRNEVRVGMRELHPDVWVGLHVVIAPSVRLSPPCWIGNDVKIEANAIIGPMTVIEDRVCVEHGAEIGRSIVLSETQVGEWTDIKDSIAWADTLIHSPDGASVKVPDKFLLGPLDEISEEGTKVSLGGRITAGLLLITIAPVACLTLLHAVIKGGPLLYDKIAVKPWRKHSGRSIETQCYCEMPSRYGWIRRWPQLWEVVCGRFALIGNRPLTPRQAEDLAQDYEKLWLAVPLGVISLADVETGIDLFGDRARAHASYYAVKTDWRLDFAIFYHVVIIRSLKSLWLSFKVQGPVPEQYPELGGQG